MLFAVTCTTFSFRAALPIGYDARSRKSIFDISKITIDSIRERYGWEHLYIFKIAKVEFTKFGNSGPSKLNKDISTVTRFYSFTANLFIFLINFIIMEWAL